MSECVGAGCTYPGCTGQHADQVNAYARAQTPAAQLQAGLVATEGLTPEQRADLRESLRRMAGSPAVQPNRAARRRAARNARRSG